MLAWQCERGEISVMISAAGFSFVTKYNCARIPEFIDLIWCRRHNEKTCIDWLEKYNSREVVW
jgi:hypothetical protein